MGLPEPFLLAEPKRDTVPARSVLSGHLETDPDQNIRQTEKHILVILSVWRGNSLPAPYLSRTRPTLLAMRF